MIRKAYIIGFLALCVVIAVSFILLSHLSRNPPTNNGIRNETVSEHCDIYQEIHVITVNVHLDFRPTMS